ncbi:MAG: phosphoribosylformylglycinamidine synthase subunit PurL [Candidatus Odinarchaeota archaeon]
MPNEKEMEKIRTTLDREPTRVEEAMFDSMWSEHCSYKSSKHWLELFTDTSSFSRVKVGPGEGAGLIDVGDEQLIGLALESHNHPSAIDPFNGAATGVGGIIRDVISQGCKPIALLDSLRFGDLETRHSQYLLENVVRGISSYGNCVGIPNIGGDVAFDPSYETNCLVNVMCIGLINEKDVIRSKAENPGDMLVVFGSRTGRDGIGGVSFASESLTEESDEDRPAVQIGDPAQEKILIDIIEELVAGKLINGMQDLGGGGFTCATSEIVFNGKCGARINVDRLPLREDGMEPWEIMISESQERMLIVVAPRNIDAVIQILDRYEVHHGVVGTVIEEDRYIVENSKGKILADVPASFLVDGFPVYNHSMEEPEERKKYQKITRDDSFFDQYAGCILDSPALGAKNFVYDQYDKHVQVRTMLEAGDNAGILDIGHGKAIGAVLDTNEYQVLLDPRVGTVNAVLRCAGKLYASGLEPVALVDCLNFGNPEKKDSYWQFVEAIRGLGKAVKELALPVVGGNVSLYNESETEKGRLRINPTPVIGLLGLAEDNTKLVRGKITAPSSKILIVGETGEDLDGSEAIRYCERMTTGKLSRPDVVKARKNGQVIKKMIVNGLLRSAKHVSRGGVFATVAKMLFETDYGARITPEVMPVRHGCRPSLTELFFGETPGRYIVEIDPVNEEKIAGLLRDENIPYGIIGTTTGEQTLMIKEKLYHLAALEKQWKHAIDRYMVV